MHAPTHDLEALAERLARAGAGHLADAIRRTVRQWSALDILRRTVTSAPDLNASRLRLASAVLALAAGVASDAADVRRDRPELVAAVRGLLDTVRGLLDGTEASSAPTGKRPSPPRGAVTRTARGRRGRA